MVHLTELQGKVVFYILQCIDNTGMPPTLREIAAHFEWRAVGSAQDVVTVLRKKGFLQPPAPGKSRQLVPTPEAYAWCTQNSDGQSFQSAKSDRLRAGSVAERSAPFSSARNAMSSASVEAAAQQAACLFVPVLGLVQAGNPNEAIEHATTTVPFLNVQKKSAKSTLFAVTVDGYSMMNVGFLPGDYLLIESLNTARNGDIVVAAVGDHEVTVKRFAMRGSQLFRQAHEQLMQKSWTSVDDIPPALLVPENSDFAAIPFGVNDSDKIIGVVRSLYRQDVN
jgi:repressor LexA